jgi:hypothetical protein
VIRTRAKYLALVAAVVPSWIVGCGARVEVEWIPTDCGPADAAPPPATVQFPLDSPAADRSTDGESEVVEASGEALDAEAAQEAPMEGSADASIHDAMQDVYRGRYRDAVSPADAQSIPPDARPITCSDSVKDGDESDVDCGGSCAGCGPHKLCYEDFDCSATASGCETASGGCFCQYITHQCVFNHCYDGKTSGDETDIDCGGTTCGACANSLNCRENSDCKSMACDAVTFLCTPSQCFDHKRDGTESDVDCGGSDCRRPCGAGQTCNSSFDCQSGHPCSTIHVCN